MDWDQLDDQLIVGIGCLLLVCVFFCVLTVTFFTLWVLK